MTQRIRSKLEKIGLPTGAPTPKARAKKLANEKYKKSLNELPQAAPLRWRIAPRQDVDLTGF